MSFSMSCSCSAIVLVTMTTRFVVLDDALDRGQQIRERLAHAGAGFDDKARLLLHRALHRRRHLDLLRPRFEVFQPPGDRAVRARADGDVERHAWDCMSAQWSRLLVAASRSSASDEPSRQSSRTPPPAAPHPATTPPAQASRRAAAAPRRLETSTFDGSSRHSIPAFRHRPSQSRFRTRRKGRTRVMPPIVAWVASPPGHGRRRHGTAPSTSSPTDPRHDAPLPRASRRALRNLCQRLVSQPPRVGGHVAFQARWSHMHCVGRHTQSVAKFDDPLRIVTRRFAQMMVHMRDNNLQRSTNRASSAPAEPGTRATARQNPARHSHRSPAEQRRSAFADFVRPQRASCRSTSRTNGCRRTASGSRCLPATAGAGSLAVAI